MRSMNDSRPAARSHLAVIAVLFVASAAGATAAGSTAHAPPAPTGVPDSPRADGVERPDSAATRRGRRLTGWLLDGRADSVASVLDSTFLRELGGEAGIRAFADKLDRGLGSEGEVVDEETFTDRSVNHYYRISRFSQVPGRTVTTHWAWRDGGTVVGMRVRPTPRPAETGHEDYRTKADLALPFDGRWYVFWGGRPPHRNYHAGARDQRFAYDFVKLEDGSTHGADGAENADYHCFGAPVLAPAPGRVIRAADSVPDNTPGEMNRQEIFGNHVVLDHGDGEYSVLAHLRHGSVAVEVGDRVDRGRRLGECGNSGHSSEPHLHYHLQDSPVPGQGTGLPAQFRSFRADGEPVERGEPVRGQFVRPSGAGGR